MKSEKVQNEKVGKCKMKKLESANEKNKKVPKKNFFNCSDGYKRAIKDKRDIECYM